MREAYKQFTFSIKLVGFATVGVICPFLAVMLLGRFDNFRIDIMQEQALRKAQRIQKHLRSAHNDLKHYLDLKSLWEGDSEEMMDTVYCDYALQLMLFKAIITEDDAQIQREAKFTNPNRMDFNEIHGIIDPLNQEEKEIAYRHLVITYLEELCGKQAKIKEGKQEQYVDEKQEINSPVSAHTDMIKQSLQRLAKSLEAYNRPLYTKLYQQIYSGE